MYLLHHLNTLPLRRAPGVPSYLRRICLITIRDHLEAAMDLLTRQDGVRAEAIVLLDYKPGICPKQWPLADDTAEQTVPVRPVEAVLEYPGLEKVLYVAPKDTHNQMVEGAARILHAAQITAFYILRETPPRYPGAQHQPNFYAANAARLEKVYSLLADEPSRECYVGRIKAILTGEAGYLPIADHEEYYHPLVHPEPGDLLIDGGVSDMVGVQKRFAASVGPQGRVFGFEPMPDMFTGAQKKLAREENYRLFPYGLGLCQETLHFSQMRDSSRVSEPGDNTIPCEVVTIDGFMEEHHIKTLQCIKLDVEGNELAALTGAKRTIRTYMPKLIICLYHKPEDLVEIPLYLHALVPEYRFYVAHSSANFLDTILYATCAKPDSGRE